MAETTAVRWSGHRAGTTEFRRLNLALWCAGAGTFILLYAVQGLLPSFTATFDVSPSESSLTLSAATGMLALAIIPVSVIAESWGRVRVMTVSLTLSALLGLLAPLAPSFEVLLGIRALQGVAMAGVPALAMGHVAAEVDRRSLGQAMGVLIAGNTIGGLSGRMVASVLGDLAGWRWAMAGVGVLSLACLVGFRLLIPPARGAAPARVPVRQLGAQLAAHLRDPGVRAVCAVSFLLMSAFVTVYNYLGYRLLAEPFDVPQALVGLVFLVYLAGTVSSTVAGVLGDRFGRLTVLWGSIVLALLAAVGSLADFLPAILVCLVLYTVGFFGAHSSASGWLNARAVTAPGQASALYLFSYYAGSSIGGASGGVAYERAGWPGLVVFIATLLAVALVLAVLLRRAQPTREAKKHDDIGGAAA
ncbi:MFS transporter [Nocardioides mesophilus]|uniref:MFS transporter n=1 Tax=Nocardioides mesophilus TaxID=433659 RepID=A0A7G9RE81_9ACTN|nr:MFS transporter [Nocardioides mesophilus]QNN53906.1 MFS transporter [Nocardioides mesophilus]